MATELDNALSQLHTLLESQAILTAAQLESNRLAEEALKLERDKADNHARELDLQAQDLAIRRETLNRAEKRLQEVLERFISAETKLVTVDDSFGETVQRVIIAIRELTSAHIDTEKAIYALLTQNSGDIRDARQASPKRLERLRTQELLLQHEETLHALQLQAAGHGQLEIPIKVLRQIQVEEEKIAELSDKLLGG